MSYIIKTYIHFYFSTFFLWKQTKKIRDVILNSNIVFVPYFWWTAQTLNARITISLICLRFAVSRKRFLFEAFLKNIIIMYMDFWNHYRRFHGWITRWTKNWKNTIKFTHTMLRCIMEFPTNIFVMQKLVKEHEWISICPQATAKQEWFLSTYGSFS